MKQETEPLKEQITNVLCLPKDLVLGKSLLSAIGRNEFYLENFQAITEFNCEKLRVQTKNGYITFLGKSLSIDYYRKDEIKICGVVETVLFE